MKFTIASLAILPLLVATAPAPAPQSDGGPTPSLPYTLKAWQPRPHEANNAKRIIDFTDVPTIEASGRHFYTQKSGGTPSTYCPVQVGDMCPPGNETVIAGLSSLYVLVPGGQTLYVEKTGAVGFTQAHSTAIPPGSKLGGFTYSPGQQVSYWGYEGFDTGRDFMACPLKKIENAGNNHGTFRAGDGEDNDWPADMVFQIFANFPEAVVPTGDLEDCFDFQAVVIDWADEGAAAWQYV